MQNDDDTPVVCVQCGSHDTTIGDGRNWSRNLYVCKQCECIWHPCSGTVTCFNLIMDAGLLVCKNCYINRALKDYQKFEQAKIKLERAVGACCPGCGSIKSCASGVGRQCVACNLYWHLCPMKEGTILFRLGSQVICDHCIPGAEKERLVARVARFKLEAAEVAPEIPKAQKMKCHECDSYNTSPCDCGLGCGHWFCRECEIFMHVCPNRPGKVFSVYRPNGNLKHVYCEDCVLEDWCGKPGQPSSKPAPKKTVSDKIVSRDGKEDKELVSTTELTKRLLEIERVRAKNDFEDPFSPKP